MQPGSACGGTRLSSEFVNDQVAILVTWIQARATKSGLIGSVRIKLRFKHKAIALPVHVAACADCRAIDESGEIELQARLCGFERKDAAGRRLRHACYNTRLRSHSAADDPVVVIATTIEQFGFATVANIPADRL